MHPLTVVVIAGAALLLGLALGALLPGEAPEPAPEAPAATVPTPAASPPAAHSPPTASGTPGASAAPGADLPVVLGMAGLPTEREVELVVDRGAFGEDWVSEPLAADRLVWPAVSTTPAAGSPEAAATTLARARARLTFGPGEAVIARPGCSASRVPFQVGAADTVLVPYPSCASSAPLLDGAPLTDRHVALARELGVLAPDPDAPPPDDAPARWLTATERRVLCAWLGGPPAEGDAAACRR